MQPEYALPSGYLDCVRAAATSIKFEYKPGIDRRTAPRS